MDNYRIISTPAIEIITKNNESITIAIPQDISLYELKSVLEEKYPNHKDVHYDKTIGILNFYKE